MATGPGYPFVNSTVYSSAGMLDEPIVFVSATGEHGSSKSQNNSRLSPANMSEREEKLDGEEAFAFYTSLFRSSEVDQECDRSREDTSTGLLVRSQRKRPKTTPLSVDSKKLRKTYSVSELFTFAQEGRLRELKEALRTTEMFDINYQDMHGWTVLMTAACGGHLDVVDYLLTLGADVEGRLDKKGRNVVNVAVASGQLEIAEWIQAKMGNNSNRQKTVVDSRPSRRTSRRTAPFHCPLCDLVLREASKHKHAHSTLHQFNCQHRPEVHAYGISPANKGYRLLLNSGWDPSGGLGSESEGQRFPVKTVLKRDRLGLGAGKPKARVTHFRPSDVSAVENVKRGKLNASGQTSGLNSLSKEQDKKSRDRQTQTLRLWEAEMRRYFNSD